MSYGNREEDVNALLNLELGGELYLNMFQGGGSYVFREAENIFCFYEIPLYGGQERYYGDYSKDDLAELVRIAYDDFT